MRSKVIPSLCLTAVLMFGACATSREDKTPAKNAPATSQNPANGSANQNTAVIADGMVVPAQPADANASAAIDAPANGLQHPDIMQKRLNKMRQSGASTEKVDLEALAMRNARPAPDNSTFTSYLGEAGYEIRTFKDHPQLSKVEKRTESNGNQTIKIFLRNGQVIQRPGKDIPVLSNAPAEAILAAGGIAPLQTGPAQTKKSSGN